MLYWSDPDQTLADHGLAVDDLQVTFTPVPEPMTVLAVSAGGLGLVGLIRRRRAAERGRRWRPR